MIRFNLFETLSSSHFSHFLRSFACNTRNSGTAIRRRGKHRLTFFGQPARTADPTARHPNFFIFQPSFLYFHIQLMQIRRFSARVYVCSVTFAKDSGPGSLFDLCRSFLLLLPIQYVVDLPSPSASFGHSLTNLLLIPFRLVCLSSALGSIGRKHCSAEHTNKDLHFRSFRFVLARALNVLPSLENRSQRSHVDLIWQSKRQCPALLISRLIIELALFVAFLDFARSFHLRWARIVRTIQCTITSITPPPARSIRSDACCAIRLDRL